VACVTYPVQSSSAGSHDPARVSPVPLHCKEMIPLTFIFCFFFFLREIKILLCGVVFISLVCYSLPFLNTLEQEME